MVDSYYLGYELSWEDSLLDVVDNFIHRVFQRTVNSVSVIWVSPNFTKIPRHTNSKNKTKKV